MSNKIQEYIVRLRRQDLALKEIFLYGKQHIDANVAELADCLLAHPNLVEYVCLDVNQLTDETGVKLARYVTTSSTIKFLNLSNNQLGAVTYLAMAAALRINTSLQYLYLYGNQADEESRIDAAFIDTLRVNPSRPASSKWWLYSYSEDFSRLQAEAKQYGHPTLQLLLSSILDAPTRIFTPLLH